MSDTGDAGSGDLAPAEVLASAGPIGVVAVGRPKPGADHEQIHRLIKAALPLVHAEQGCEQYVVHSSVEEPGVYVFYERWSSGPDLLRHLRNPDLRVYSGQFFENLEYELTWLRPLEV